MIPTTEFWFDFASTYSYPAAMRIDRLADATGISVAWRPFLLGPIFAAQGWNDSPFNIYPTKGRYMWRDLERICAKANIPLRHPSRFPRNALLAARVANHSASAGFRPSAARCSRQTSPRTAKSPTRRSCAIASTAWACPARH